MGNACSGCPVVTDAPYYTLSDSFVTETGYTSMHLGWHGTLGLGIHAGDKFWTLPVPQLLLAYATQRQQPETPLPAGRPGWDE
jgi:hypothetical protein